MKNILVIALAFGMWVGLSAEFTGDSGFRLDLQSAQAGKNDGGSSGDGDGGKSSGGKSSDRDSGGKNEKANKQDKKAEKAEKIWLKKELSGLKSLRRNINGLINSNSSKLAEFRAIFVNRDGTLKEEAELPDDEALTDMLRNFLGAEPSEAAVIDTRARLENLAEQFAELDEKSADDDEEDDDVDDDDDEDEDEDEDEDDDDDEKRKIKNKS